MLKAYKYRLVPNRAQREYFAKTFGSVRFLYNQMLADRKAHYELYKHDKKLLYAIKLRTYTSFKQEFPFLREPDNLALANAKLDLDAAYQKFYKHGTGFPVFKSKHHSKASYKTNNQKGSIRILNNRIKLPKIGFVKFKHHRKFSGLIKSCTVSMTPSGNYYISVLVEQDGVPWIPAPHKIGIDLGLTDFAITTNDAGFSEKIANPRHLEKAEKKLKRAQQRLSRKKEGSKNRGKARKVVAKKHEEIANQRKDFLHKLSHKIVHENQVIVLETLSSKNMMQNRRLAKAIASVSWSEFTRQLEYKALWLGRTIIKADRWYPSSQICSACGDKGSKKPLGIRTWTCIPCGTDHDRDINASRNLLSLAL